MLEELLKHDKFGNREELLFILFDGLSSTDSQSLGNVQKYCISNVFSIARSFKAILDFLEFISFIEINEDNISVNKANFDQSIFEKKSYLEHFHLYGHLLRAFDNNGIFQEIFHENNIKFNNKLYMYYILDNKFSFKYVLFRNFLISTGFFQRRDEFPNHLLVKKEFTDQFKVMVIDKLITQKSPVKKMSLEQLKKKLKNNEQAGKEAEVFVLEYEHKRLNGHPDIERIGILSNDYVNAGYDIETFNDIDSIIIDRFIEVKSYVGEISFYWSKKEVDKANELSDKYFLYLVDRSRMTEKEYTPQKFQNPYKKIFENDIWKKETESWKITFED